MAGPAPIVTNGTDDEEDEQPQVSPLTQALSGNGRTPDSANSVVQPTLVASNAPPSLPSSVNTATSPSVNSPIMLAATARPTVPPAPVAPALDTNKYQQLEQAALQARQPVNRNAPGVRPTWYDRLAGAAAGFGVGWKSPEQGVQVGQGVTEHRYNNAVADQQAKAQSADQALGDFQNQNNMARANYTDQTKQYENTLAGVRENREQGVADSRSQYLEARADKYDNTIDPSSIRFDANAGKWYGHTFGAPDKDIETGAPKGLKAAASPKNYEEMVMASNDPNTPPEQRAALKASISQIQRAEVKKFQAAQPRASEGEVQYGDWKRAFVKQNGRAPNADEINTYRRNGAAGEKPRIGTPGQFAKVQAQTADAYAKAQAAYKAGVIDAQELAEQNRQIGTRNSELTRALGGVPAEDSAQSAQPAQPANAVQSGTSGAAPGRNSAPQPAQIAQPAQAAQATDMVRVQKPDGNVVRIPRANLQKAIQLGGKPL